MTSEKRLYFLAAIGCLAGYAWIYYCSTSSSDSICFFKNITHLPCPSCGSTRSALHLMHGEAVAAMQTNPLGIVVATLLIVAPLWILFDVLFKKKSAYLFYRKAEQFLQRRIVYVPLAMLMLMNWIWNIAKEL